MLTVSCSKGGENVPREIVQQPFAQFPGSRFMPQAVALFPPLTSGQQTILFFRPTFIQFTIVCSSLDPLPLPSNISATPWFSRIYAECSLTCNALTPPAVIRYFCSLLLGLSGIVYSIRAFTSRVRITLLSWPEI